MRANSTLRNNALLLAVYSSTRQSKVFDERNATDSWLLDVRALRFVGLGLG